MEIAALGTETREGVVRSFFPKQHLTFLMKQLFFPLWRSLYLITSLLSLYFVSAPVCGTLSLLLKVCLVLSIETLSFL